MNYNEKACRALHSRMTLYISYRTAENLARLAGMYPGESISAKIAHAIKCLVNHPNPPPMRKEVAP